jgi:hypothetical protein
MVHNDRAWWKGQLEYPENYAVSLENISELTEIHDAQAKLQKTSFEMTLKEYDSGLHIKQRWRSLRLCHLPIIKPTLYIGM